MLLYIQIFVYPCCVLTPVLFHTLNKCIVFVYLTEGKKSRNFCDLTQTHEIGDGGGGDDGSQSESKSPLNRA